MLLIQLIALALVIAGIVIITRGNLWAGVALIAVGVLVFLLRNAIVDNNDTAVVLPFVFKRVIPWDHAPTGSRR